MQDVKTLLVLGLVLFLSTKRDGRARFVHQKAAG